MTDQTIPPEKSARKERSAVPLSQRKIHVYKPLQDGRKYIAMIAGFPGVFKGSTAVGASRSAKRFAEAIEAKKSYVAEVDVDD